jgi:hypothetical protein
MTFTATTWTTLAVQQVEGFIIVYRDGGDVQRFAVAPVVLVQHDPDTNTRRQVLAAVDTSTGELIPAPDVPGYVATITAEARKLDAALPDRRNRDYTPKPGALA